MPIICKRIPCVQQLDAYKFVLKIVLDIPNSIRNLLFIGHFIVSFLEHN